MGGTAVAIGSVDLAAGHNPALLGLYDEDEDKSRNGRYYLPFAVGSLSQVAIDAIKLLNDELDVVFDQALDRYNLDPNSANAGDVSQAASQLEDGLLGIANKDINFSVFASYIAVAEPGPKGGGGFYFGSRIEGGGRSYIPDSDIDLFEDYVEALKNVAAGGYWRDVHPELFNADPAYVDFEPPPLNDPFDKISSRADLRGLIINEVAVAGAWGFDFDKMRVAVGFTPKVMQVRVFDESREVSNDDLETTNSIKPYHMFNADIGVVVAFDNGIRVAYAGKDLFTRTFNTDANQTVHLNTKHRMGAGFVRPTWQIGFDYDMQKEEAKATESTGQFLSFGAEYTLLGFLDLRAGYRYDTDGLVAAATTVGLGVHWKRLQTNLSYLASKEDKGAALQIGFAF